METITKLTSVAGLILALVVAKGCAKEVPPASPSTNTAVGEPARTSPSDAATAERSAPANSTTLPTEGNPAAEPGVEGTPPAADQAGNSEIQASLASLSAADREAALKQRICPVSDAALGSMGAPIKVTVAGQDVFICCEHCEEPLKAEPAKHLAKIGLQPAEGSAVE
jgi:hypothetical protein